MNKRFTSVATAALLCTSAAFAQNCPRTKAAHINESITYGPSVRCSGLEIRWGGFVLNPGDDGCPVFARIVPEHDIEAPSELDTQCVVTQTNPTVHITIDCVLKYLIIIPISSSCLVRSTQNTGTVQSLLTVGCPAKPVPAEPSQPPQGN